MKEDRIKVSFADALAIIRPYIYAKMAEQVRSVLPIVGYLFLFQLIVLQMPVLYALEISLGLLAVIFGLMFFMEGLRLGLMPLGETIGADLPKKRGFAVIFGFAFLLGIGATLAEPAIGALQSVGMAVNPADAPLLYLLLTKMAGTLALAVGVGVGIAVILGILRFVYGFSLKIYAVPMVLILSALTVWAFFTPYVNGVIGLAWDCGAVTTGPVTVPLVLALGLGVSRVVCSNTDSGMSGFGIITLASLFPIMAVLLLAFGVYYFGDVDLANVKPMELAGGENNIILDSTLAAVQAIVPLTLFLYLVQKLIVREPIRHLDEILLGIFFTVFGMAFFNLGLFSGLIPLGDQVGGLVPGTFSTIQTGTPPAEYGPLYGTLWGKAVAIGFAFFLGYGATLAEPALSALGSQVEIITVGAFKKRLLIQTVAIGVGMGIALGVAKMIFNVPLVYLLLPPYALLLAITLLSNETMTNIGWDAAGVTTGPITVPLVIALGLGVGANIPGVVDGFGILSLASVFPILSVLSMGLLVRYTSRKHDSQVTT